MIKVNRFYNFDLKGMEQYFNERALKGYEIEKINETYFTFRKISPKKSYYHFITTGECEGKMIFKNSQFSLYETNEPLETETFTKCGYEGINIAFIFISGLFVLLQLFGLKYPYYDEKFDQ